MSGHVFVVRGDLRALPCDIWLLPTDQSLYLSDDWARGLPGPPPAPPDDWGDDRRRAFPVSNALPDRPVPWLVNVGRTPGTPVGWYMDGVRQFLEAAVASLRERTPLHDRAKPLVGLPLVGTGEGGAGQVAGKVASTLRDLLWEASRRLDVDVVLVTANAPAFAAAQARRRTAGQAGHEVPGGLGDRARELGTEAARGRLVVFLGAGISAGAGIPLWGSLLDRLARDSGFGDDERAACSGVSTRWTARGSSSAGSPRPASASKTAWSRTSAPSTSRSRPCCSPACR